MLAFVPPFSGFLMLAEALNTIPTIPEINGIYIYIYISLYIGYKWDTCTSI